MTIILATVGILAFAGLAGAHAQKQRFAPRPNSVMTAAPTDMNFFFTDDLKDAHVEVLNANGELVTSGKPLLDPTDPKHVTVPLKANLAEGTYSVKWETGSVDGHTTSGRHEFHVTYPGDSDAVRIFLDGREVTSDVPARIVDGRTMVSVRAVAEAMGKWVEWDEEQRFVILSEAPTVHMNHKTYQHPAGIPEPALKLEVKPDAKMGFNVHAETTNWIWAPEKANTAPEPGAGHAHLYVDGVKVARLYGPWYHLEGLTPGQHDVQVTLNANDHSEYAVSDHGAVAATVSIVQRTNGKSSGGMSQTPSEGHMEGAHSH